MCQWWRDQWTIQYGLLIGRDVMSGPRLFSREIPLTFDTMPASLFSLCPTGPISTGSVKTPCEGILKCFAAPNNLKGPEVGLLGTGVCIVGGRAVQVAMNNEHGGISAIYKAALQTARITGASARNVARRMLSAEGVPSMRD
jgi:hypothetical protein